jgi:hypothetical protein
MIRCHCGYKGEGSAAFIAHRCDQLQPRRVTIQHADDLKPAFDCRRVQRGRREPAESEPA